MKRFACCLLLALGLSTAARAERPAGMVDLEEPARFDVDHHHRRCRGRHFHGHLHQQRQGLPVRRLRRADQGQDQRQQRRPSSPTSRLASIPITAWKGTVGDKTISTSWQLSERRRRWQLQGPEERCRPHPGELRCANILIEINFSPATVYWGSPFALPLGEVIRVRR